LGETDLQLGGGYKYQWECAILLALNYLFDDPLRYNPTLHDLITSFLGRVEQVQLEGIDHEKDQELEDINLLTGQKRRILIQVKTKEAEGRQWTISDPLLLKALSKFYLRQLSEESPEQIRYVFLTNQPFNADLVKLNEVIGLGALSQSLPDGKMTEAGSLHKQFSAYLKKEKQIDEVDFNRFCEMLLNTRLAFFLQVDVVEAVVQNRLQAYGRQDWKEAYAVLFTAFANQSTRKGGGTIRRDSLVELLGEPLRQQAGQPTKNLWTVPFPSLEKQFLGRQNDLARLADRMEVTGRVGIFGMGGLGKTQFAAEYAYLYKEIYPHGVFWLNATNPLINELAGIADALNLVPKLAPRDQAAFAARDYLEKNPLAILIIDNVEDPNDLNHLVAAGLIPGSLKGRLLFTTRRADFPANLEPFEIKGLSVEDSLVLLLRARPEILSSHHPDQGIAKEIVAALGGLPLALELAATYLGTYRDISLSEYVKWLREEGGLDVVDESDVSPEQLATRHETAVRVTLSHQWDRLDDRDARNVFMAAGQLGKGSLIPVARLAMMAGIGLDLRPGRPSPIRKALNKLHNLTLVESLSDERVRLHPLVYDFTQSLVPNPSELKTSMVMGLLQALQDIPFFERQIEQRGIKALIEDLDIGRRLAKTADKQELQATAWLLKNTLLSSAQILDNDIQQLSGQLTGRLAGYTGQVIQEFLGKIRKTSGHPWLRPLTPSLRSPDDPLRAVLSGHEGTVKGLAITPDGERAVSAGSSSPDLTLRVWDLHNCLEIFWVKAEIAPGAFVPVGITPDGAWAMCAYENRIQRWDVRAKTAANPLEGHQGKINWLAVADDSPILVSCSDSGELIAWDTDNWQILRKFPNQEGNIERVVVSPDGKNALSISSTSCQIWDVENGRMRFKHEADNFKAGGLVPGPYYLSPDGRWAQVGTFRWEFDSRKWDQNFEFPGQFDALALVKDGQYLFTKEGFNTSLLCVDGKTGLEQFTLKAAASQSISTLAITPDGKRAIVAYYDHYLRLWELDRAKKLADQPETMWIQEINVLPGGNQAVVWIENDRVETFDINTGKLNSSPEAREILLAVIQEDQVHRAKMDRFREEHIKPKGLVRTEPSEITVGNWSPPRDEAILDFRDEKVLTSQMILGKVSEAEEPDDTDWEKDEFWLRITDEYGVRFWDSTKGTEPLLLRGHTSPVLSGQISQDGRLAITSAIGRIVRVWDIETKEQKIGLRGHLGMVYRVRLDPLGRYAVSVSEDRSVRVWDLENRELLATLTTDAPLYRCGVGRSAESGKMVVVAAEKAGRLHFLELEKEV
jgi:WD40 repeat protein